MSAPAEVGSANEETRSATHVRGSSLLLVGRLLSVGINLASQVLIARQLTKLEFGAFATALALAGLGQVIITLGLHRGASTFIATYQEERAHARIAGTILLYLAVVLGMGALLVALVGFGQGWLVESGYLDPTTTALLLILILLAPVDALDDMLIALFALFGSPRSIFVRRYLLGPSIRLIVAAILVFAAGDAQQLAIGYLLGGVFAVVLYGALFVRLLHGRGLLEPMRAQRPDIPAREVLGFSIPLLSTDGIWLLLNTFPILVLTAASGLQEVAGFQVVKPMAALNLLVSGAFYVLYLPIASRVAAKQDASESRELYWRSAMWVSVMTFPVFVATFALGQGIVGWLFGEQYASSGVVLSILSVGYFVHAALGFNTVALGAHGHPRAVLLVNAVTAVVSVLIVLALIPPFGALGAACAAALTLITQNVLLQFALWRRVGIPMIEREALGVFALMAGAMGVLILAELALGFGWWSFVLAGVTTAFVLYRCRGALQIGTLFPEVHAIIIRSMAAVGKRARRLIARLDLLWAAGPIQSLRRGRTARGWRKRARVVRDDIARRAWLDAATDIGAQAEPAGPGAIRLQADGRQVLVRTDRLSVDDDRALQGAKDRAAVRERLREHGLPVPDSRSFRFAEFEAAATFLREHGGPAVVVAADGAVGSGGTSQVRERSDLVRAIIREGRATNQLMIEAVVPGEAHRLIFLDGALLDAVERRRPRVVGDGRSTIAALIDATNRERVDAGGAKGLALLEADLDCILTLRAAGLTLDTVPAQGAEVEIRTAVDQNGVDDDRAATAPMHPALVEQARQAAALLGLRSAAVDIVTPDVSVPLEEVGGAIVHVDGAPAVHHLVLGRPPAESRAVMAAIARVLLDGDPG